jgi:hypothetical protein
MKLQDADISACFIDRVLQNMSKLNVHWSKQSWFYHLVRSWLTGIELTLVKRKSRKVHANDQSIFVFRQE